MLRNRLGIPGVIAVIALVFAMIGGAWAAKGGVIITKLSQISPGVQKKLKGAKGPQGNPGPAGPAGPAGAAGPAGTDGLDGEKGATGAAGAPGTPGSKGATGATGPSGLAGATGPTGVDGAEGATGPTGSPWVPDNELPSGAKLTGSWSMGAIALEGTTNNPAFPFRIPISFSIPLAAGLPSTNAHWLKEGESGGEDCPGSAADPEAKAGHLCVYTTDESEQWNGELPLTNWSSIGGITKAGAPGTEAGVSTAGAFLNAYIFGENAYAFGTWAVKAP